jgi:SAM-dependent methyltransferase
VAHVASAGLINVAPDAVCKNRAVIDPSQDAFGVALLDYLEGKDVPELVLEDRQDRQGRTGPAMHPEWFFRNFEQWDWWERKILPLVTQGPVLDLGAGAGRAALYLQQRGLPVTAVDASPGAAEVCRRRGVADVRLGDVNDPPEDRRWAAVLLLCGNLGLGGSWDGSRRLLARLAELVMPGAVLAGDSVTPAGASQADLRIRYRDLVTPWWPQYNIPAFRPRSSTR